MSKTQVQFQKKCSLVDFVKDYGIEEQCGQARFKWRWPDGFRCPDMNIKYFVFILMFIPLAQADVYKCKLATGKIVYQLEQCDKNTVQQGVVKIKKLSPEEAEASKARLRAWQEQQDIEDAAKKEAEKARQMEIQEQQEMELERQRIAAEQKAAIEAECRRELGTDYTNPYYRNKCYRNKGN